MKAVGAGRLGVATKTSTFGNSSFHRYRRQATEIGDWKWGELLQQHEVIVRRELARFRGREVNTAGDGFLIAFDGAIRRGLSISRQVRSLGIDTVSRPFAKCLERWCACP